jgi:hypothetical protein
MSSATNVTTTTKTAATISSTPPTVGSTMIMSASDPSSICKELKKMYGSTMHTQLSIVVVHMKTSQTPQNNGYILADPRLFTDNEGHVRHFAMFTYFQHVVTFWGYLSKDALSRIPRHPKYANLLINNSRLISSFPDFVKPSPPPSFCYAVRRGRVPGVYRTWWECQTQIEDFDNPDYKIYTTYNDAYAYIHSQ